MRTSLSIRYDILGMLVEVGDTDARSAQADSADDLPAAKSILAGAKKRHSVTGKAPILIHTARIVPTQVLDWL